MYLDLNRTTEERVDDLLGRMTVEEKVGQMALVSVSRLLGDCAGGRGALSPACLQFVLERHHVGSILSGGGEAPRPNTPRAWAEMTNAIQRHAIERSRLHIPVLYGADAVHGHNNVLGATIFPHNIGLAASWDPDLVEEVAASTARAARATGVHWIYAPAADLARDLRWGRYYETYGEDPLLASRCVSSAVRGLERASSATRVAASVKHFVGYSQPMTGHDRTAAQLPLRYLRDAFLPPFKSGIDSGGATVMINSGSVNGVPVHASRYLLIDVLRQQMGFRGVAVSDWGDIEALYVRYHVASSHREAIRIAVNAGVDMSMVPFETARFTETVLDLVREGRVPIGRIDEAVRRVLTLKFELGLFERPFVDVERADAVVLDADRDLASRAARESLTLLKNDHNLLPLPKDLDSVLIVGAPAASVASQMGGWTVGWQGVPGGEEPPAVTILKGIDRKVSERTSVNYLSTATSHDEIERLTREADVAIAVVGEEPYAESWGDTETAELPPEQSQLIRTLAATQTPVVVVVLAGRPLMLRDISERAGALLMAWLPGTEGGTAVGDALFGDFNPGGRMPVSWPRRIGASPMFYTWLRGNSQNPESEYHPLFPFGHGLSYTTYTYSRLHVDVSPDGGDALTAIVDVTNAGTVSGTAVVPLYVHQEVSSVLVPDRRLIDFARVELGPGERRTVTLSIPISRLAVIPGDIVGLEDPVVEPGVYRFMVESEHADVTIR